MGLWVHSTAVLNEPVLRALLTQEPPLLLRELQQPVWFCLFHLPCSPLQTASPLKGQRGLMVAECHCRAWQWAVVEHAGAVGHITFVIQGLPQHNRVFSCQWFAALPLHQPASHISSFEFRGNPAELLLYKKHNCCTRPSSLLSFKCRAMQSLLPHLPTRSLATGFGSCSTGPR